jgi:cytochrome c biogenesis protein CcmG/thiol:disulfide interchange protein DsbE
VRRFLWLAPIVVLFAVAGVALFRVRPAAELGKPPARFSLPSVLEPEQKITLDEIVGSRPVVLNFWATWCDPCKEEAPELARTARRYEGEVTFLGISVLDGPGPAGRFMREEKVPYESVSDTRGVTAKRYGMTGVPETIFIDADGLVVGRYIGAFRPGELGRLVAELVELRPGEFLQITGRGATEPVP